MSRSVRSKSDKELIEEYVGLFQYKPVQQVMRYLAVQRELLKRMTEKQLKARSNRRKTKIA